LHVRNLTETTDTFFPYCGIAYIQIVKVIEFKNSMLKKLIERLRTILLSGRKEEVPEQSEWLDRSKTLNGWADRK